MSKRMENYTVFEDMLEKLVEEMLFASKEKKTSTLTDRELTGT